MNVRVRYAPSPTGLQHIGGVRTALFNYFFARSRGGRFILRVEDTDRQRYSDEAMEDLYTTFQWLDVGWDEGPRVGGDFGPYVQSERVELYRSYAKKLVESGNAYPCYCSPERLEQVRFEQQKSKQKHQGYDRHCRELSPEQRAEYDAEGFTPVIRFKVPLEGETLFSDILLGDIRRQNEDINPDPVLLKADGFPTYHLANVVDDHLMEISHILRAQEWLPSGSLHVLLYEAFGWNPPVYCHLPMVMGKDGQKLSKRHGSTSLREFREQGYLPEAVINYVSQVGWSYDNEREFFTKEELEELFSLEKLSKSPGVFDYQKLQWFNGHYIREKEDGELKALLLPYLLKDGLVDNPPSEEQQGIIDKMIPLVKERLRLLSEVGELVRFLFEEPVLDDPQLLVPKKGTPAEALSALNGAADFIPGFESRSDEENEELVRAKSEELGMKLGAFLMPLRVAVTGSTSSPPLFGSMRLLGERKALERVDRAQKLLRD